MNKDEYVIIKINYITKNEEDKIPLLEEYDKECYNGIAEKELYSRKEVESLLGKILSNSIPLIPEIEKAFVAGENYQMSEEWHEDYEGDITQPNKQDYINQLKIDI